MSAATRYGDGWVATTYLIRHLKRGVLTDCAYAEKPTDAELEEVCKHHELEYTPELIRIVELPLVSGLPGRAEPLGALDAWEPPPPPVVSVGGGIGELSAVLDPDNAANIVDLKVKISGTGLVTPAPEATGAS